MLAVVSLGLIILGLLIFPFSKKLHIPKTFLILFIVVFLAVFASQSIVVIDAGEVGVQIFFGKVIRRPLQSGPNFKIPLVQVVKYPTRLREYTMSSMKQEGEKIGDDSIKVRTFDGLEIKIDSTVWWKIDKEKIYDIYENIAKNTAELKQKVVRPVIRTAIRDICSNYTMKELYSAERQNIGGYIKKKLKPLMENKNVLIGEVLIRNVKLPAKVEESIENKLKKQQEAEAMEAKKQIAQKEAEIKEIEAKGLARAQEIIKKNLSPEYLQHEAIQAYKDLAKSQSSTFIIMPTTDNGTGMPLILNPKNSPVPEKKNTENTTNK